jgi:hypothetical protein
MTPGRSYQLADCGGCACNEGVRGRVLASARTQLDSIEALGACGRGA